jgi:predicted transposase/invertase (TIGR01784 family)
MDARNPKTPKRKAPRSTPELLSPATDIVFKLLFGDERNKDILAAFLTAVLGFRVLPRGITLIDPHLKRNYLEDKLGILDVRLRLRNKKFINIEMQAENKKGIRGRLEYYISKGIADQLKRNDDHGRLIPTVMILVSKQTVLPETEKYHSEFGTLEKTEHFELHGLKSIHILELSKLPKQSDLGLVDWLRFINAEKKEDFVALAKKNKRLGRAVKALELASATARTRDLYEYRVKAARDKRAELAYAKEEGWAEGKAEGKAVGREEGRVEERDEILALIRQGLSAAEIEEKLSLKLTPRK